MKKLYQLSLFVVMSLLMVGCVSDTSAKAILQGKTFYQAGGNGYYYRDVFGSDELTKTIYAPNGQVSDNTHSIAYDGTAMTINSHAIYHVTREAKGVTLRSNGVNSVEWDSLEDARNDTHRKY